MCLDCRGSWKKRRRCRNIHGPNRPLTDMLKWAVARARYFERIRWKPAPVSHYTTAWRCANPPLEKIMQLRGRGWRVVEASCQVTTLVVKTEYRGKANRDRAIAAEAKIMTLLDGAKTLWLVST